MKILLTLRTHNSSYTVNITVNKHLLLHSDTDFLKTRSDPYSHKPGYSHQNLEESIPSSVLTLNASARIWEALGLHSRMCAWPTELISGGLFQTLLVRHICLNAPTKQYDFLSHHLYPKHDFKFYAYSKMHDIHFGCLD